MNISPVSTHTTTTTTYMLTNCPDLTTTTTTIRPHAAEVDYRDNKFWSMRIWGYQILESGDLGPTHKHEYFHHNRHTMPNWVQELTHHSTLSPAQSQRHTSPSQVTLTT